MSDQPSQRGAADALDLGASELLQPIRAALVQADETDRYRLLASVLMEMAELSAADNGRGGASAEQLEGLTKRVQALGEEKATLNDALATTRADLAHRAKQEEAERARAEELQHVVEDQRARLEKIQQEHTDLEAELVARNAEVHRHEVENDRLLLQLQRAERDSGNIVQIEKAEGKTSGLAAELNQVREEYEQLRIDKDAEIERYKEQLVQVKAGASEGADTMLAEMWDRLARAKPSLAPGHVPPNKQAAERLVDAFCELVRFVDDFDKGMRVFLGQYTRHHPSVKVPWDVYARRDDVYTTAKQTVAPQGGKPVGLLKMRLRVLYSWGYAAMLGCDSAIESVASELHSHLMGEVGAGSDANRKIRDYLRDDGHELFLQHIKELRSQKLAEAFGRGG